MHLLLTTINNSFVLQKENHARHHRNRKLDADVDRVYKRRLKASMPAS